MSQQDQQNPFDKAQSILAKSNNTMDLVKYALIGLGGLLAIGGVFTMIFGSFTSGIVPLIMGGVLIYVARTQLSMFEKMLGDASAMVDGYAAQAQLAQTGLPAQATIESAQQTGTMVNYNPEVRFSLKLTHPNTGVEYTVEMTSVVPQIAIPQVQPGAQVPVRVDPDDPQRVALAI